MTTTTAHLKALANQLSSFAMTDREAAKIEAPPFDLILARSKTYGFSSLIFAAAVAGLGLFGLIASASGEPLLLTILAVLAMLGAFMLFALAGGHLRFGGSDPSADLVKAAMDAAGDAILVSGRDGTVRYANGAHERMFGRSDGGGLMALHGIFNGDGDSAEALFRLNRAAESGTHATEDIRVRGGFSSRTERWLRVSVRPFVAIDHPTVLVGSGQFVLWRATDVTADYHRERSNTVRVEAALAAFDTMPAGFLVAEPDGKVSHLNSTFAGWLDGRAGKREAGTMMLRDIAGDDGAALLSDLAGEADIERRSIDLDLTSSDGRLLPLTLAVEPLGAGNTSAGFSVTALNRSVHALAGRRGGGELRYSQFFQSVPFGIATVDAAGHLASANAAFMRMFLAGRGPNDQPAADVLCQFAETDERAAIEASLAHVLTGRANAAPTDITGGPTKEQFRRVYMSPLALSGNGDAAALYVIDTTEQKALEHRVAQAQKMEAVGNLAGGIAHDFNNVLTAIIGFSDLLLQTHRPSDPAYKDIRNIQSAAHRAAGLVANLLGFSRKQTQQISVLNLGELTTDLTPMLKTSIGERIELKIESERDLWYVKADKAQIESIILNLSANARDAMLPSGGRLLLRTRNVGERESLKLGYAGFVPGEYVLIEVEDTGTGMNAETLEKVFEPFFTTKGVGKGTGLGLSSVYGIVKQSSGFIVPESQFGVGTMFRIFLPRFALEDHDGAEAPVKPLPRPDLSPADLTGTGRVLLVEDEVEVRQFAVRALRRQGYQVLEAADGVEALEIMKSNDGKIDLVVSDVVMPEMDGPALFKELRRLNPATKVIFVSGYPNEAFREQLGTDDFAFLPKPFSLPQLAEKVKLELAR